MPPMSSPGPNAARAFEGGWRAATVGGLAAITAGFVLGPLSVSDPVHLVITALLFPIYLLFVAIVLCIWLGYDTDITDLRLASETDDEHGRDPWENWPW